MENKSKSFEQSLARLEQIVSCMERGDVPLEEALKLFEEGTSLVASCTKLLDDAEMKVVLMSKGADGTPEERSFENEE